MIWCVALWTCLLTGCGASVAQREAQADKALASGKPDDAVGSLESALKQARKESADAATIARLEEKLASARTASGQLHADRARAYLAEARTHADARRWAKMAGAIDKAVQEVARSNDPALQADVERVRTSKLAMLGKAAKIYAQMSKEAGWSDVLSWLGSDDWFVYGSEFDAMDLGFKLVDQCTEIGDAELRDASREVSKKWNEYMRAKEMERSRDRNRKDDEGILGVIVDVVVTANSISKSSAFTKARRTFEARLNTLLDGERFPELTPVVVAASQPVPAASAAPVAVSFSVAPPPAPRIAAAPVEPAEHAAVTAPRAPAGPRSTTKPDDDMEQLIRTGN